MSTLEVFDDIATLGTGTVLYSRRWKSTPLPRNLHAALAATGLGLSSLDYAKKSYTFDDPTSEDLAESRYIDAYLAARDHMTNVRAQLQTTPRSQDHMGGFAASVALQRLDSGFRATHLLYRLGLNVEGDAVARQFLEQVAWAFAAARLDDLEMIDRVSATKAIGVLKDLVPEVGRMYGRLSDVAHAGLQEHRRLVRLGPHDSPQIVMANARFSESATTLLNLADVWVLVCEMTQAHQLPLLVSLRSFADLVPDPGRAFRRKADQLVAAIVEVE